jgi:hypothetical protein
MELTNKEADQIKWVYDAFYGGRINANEALEKLEQLINGDN